MSHALQDCRAYMKAHLHQHHEKGTAPARTRQPMTITISRQTGARGRSIGDCLVQTLRAENKKQPVSWTLFDDNLVQQILNDHDLPETLAKFMPDDKVDEFQSIINEILGRHPSSWTLFEYTMDTLLRLAHLGNCILVGRGANVITRSLPNVLHVRFVGSRELRIKHMARRQKRSFKETAAMVKKEDTARRNYFKQHFDRDIDDPDLYDLIINTDHLSDSTVTDTVIAALHGKQSQL